MPESEPKRRRAPRPRRKAETDPAGGSFNPGQMALLMDLLREFSSHVQVDLTGGAGKMTVKVETDLPFLENFIGFKIRDLASEQRRLADLWEMSEAG